MSLTAEVPTEYAPPPLEEATTCETKPAVAEEKYMLEPVGGTLLVLLVMLVLLLLLLLLLLLPLLLLLLQ
jgi:hypothetical protein